MIDQSTAKGRIVAAALKLAGERPWDEVTYFDIAEAAGLSLVDLRRELASKSEILVAFARSVDDHVLSRAAKPTAALPPRDRLFEVVMSRFDALMPYKRALQSIARSRSGDLALIAALFASQTWMLRAAGIGTEGLGGSARVLGLAGVYASVFRTWLADDDPGMARTMAALDRRLRRGERCSTSVEQAMGAINRAARAFKSRRAPRAADARPATDEAEPEKPESPAPAA